MHPDADAFLDAIFDSPDDDTPRLVYADWLQEHGQEHYAQFIRLQCAAARYPLWSGEANRLWEEIGRVWNRLDDEWRPATWDEWKSTLGTGRLDAIHFDRGFLRPNLMLTDFQLQDYLNDERCWSCVALPGPPLLLTPFADWAKLASLPLLRRIRHLRLASFGEAEAVWDSDWLPDELAELLRCERLCHLTRLDVSERNLTQRVADVLVSAPHLSSVQQLAVSLSTGRGPDPDAAVEQLEARFKNVVWASDWDGE